MNCCASNRKDQRQSATSTTALLEYMNSRMSFNTKLVMERQQYPQYGSPDATSQITAYTQNEEQTRFPNEQWQGLMNQRRSLVANQKILCHLLVGVSATQRTKVWWWVTDVQHTLIDKHSPNIFSKLTQLPSESDQQIQKDVVRTFTAPSNKHYSNSLFNVLRAYANYDTEIGYTQGMNCIAAVLFQHFVHETLPHEAEVQTFWIMVYILMEKQYREVFKSGMDRAFELMNLLDIKLSQKAPNIFNFMKDHQVTTMMCFDYLIFTMMLQQCPNILALRIVDMFLLKGQDIIIKLLVKIVILLEEEILSQSSPDELIIYMRRRLLDDAFKKLSLSDSDCIQTLFFKT